jgi:hypothetical protein
MCECDVTTKGMLARSEGSELPLEKVFTQRISAKIETLMSEQEQIAAVISEVLDEKTSRPVWVLILQLPAKILSYPINLLRSLFIKPLHI